MHNMLYSEQIRGFISVAENAMKRIDELDKLKEENPEDEKRIDALSHDIECYDYELVNLLFGPVF